MNGKAERVTRKSSTPIKVYGLPEEKGQMNCLVRPVNNLAVLSKIEAAQEEMGSVMT